MRGMNAGNFPRRGPREAAEMSLTVLCYNLRRTPNAVAVDKLIGAVDGKCVDFSHSRRPFHALQ